MILDLMGEFDGDLLVSACYTAEGFTALLILSNVASMSTYLYYFYFLDQFVINFKY